TRLVSRVRQTLGIELPLRVVFEHSTVADLAACVGAAWRREEGLEAPPIRPAARRDVPLSFAQQRLWVLDRLDPGSSLYNISTALRLTGRLDTAALGRALDEIVRRHQVLRTRFEAIDDEPVQVIQPDLGLPLPIVDLGGLPAAGRLLRTAARQPFDLARGPLVRAVLMRLGPDEHMLFLSVHHIAFDGWSAGVFVDELTALYQAFSTGRSSPLPDLPVQYADFAVWQRQWLRGEVLERQLAYWREQLAGLPVLDLPCDRPRPATQSFRGSAEPLRLSGELGRGL
ncbi:MAG: non-ribosomal peptide synthetase, partial [bacterium]|nr:non-ribosomal peptide synthetase [bacterium]